MCKVDESQHSLRQDLYVHDAEAQSQLETIMASTDKKLADLHDRLDQAQQEKAHLSCMLAADRKAHGAAMTSLHHQVEHVHPKQIQDLHEQVIVDLRDP